MNTKSINSKANLWRSIIAIIAILCLLLSACPIKLSIKKILGIAVNQTQNIPTNTIVKDFLAPTFVDCIYDRTSRQTLIHTVMRKDLTKTPFLVGLLLICMTEKLASYRTKTKLLYKTPPVLTQLPIFLKCRKLLI